MTLVKILILPPGVLVLLLIVGWLLTARRGRPGRAFLAGVIAVFWALSTPLLGGMLLRAVSVDAHPPQGKFGSAAIVVLGGTFETTANGAEPGALTLERLARAAALHRTQDIPILVTAGQLRHLEEPGAAIMARSLREIFGVPVRWQEGSAKNTRENALESAKILRDAEIERALVVTHRWHLRRAMLAFETTQIDAIPVAVHARQAPRTPEWRDLLPTLAGLEGSYYALYETFGLIWYKIRN
jgi:uncharacterized SAM-binding protein YcdF (DUF218 family)